MSEKNPYLQALQAMPLATREMAVFGLRQASHDAQTTCATGGHGYDHCPEALHPLYQTYGAQGTWALLDDRNARPTQDYNFLAAYNPRAMRADAERKIDLLLAGDHDTIRVLIQQWSHRKDFRDEWTLPTPTNREHADRRRDLNDALNALDASA